MLGAMFRYIYVLSFRLVFSGRFAIKPEEDGFIFIDRNGDHFSVILDFLRYKYLFINSNSFKRWEGVASFRTKPTRESKKRSRLLPNRKIGRTYRRETR